MNGDISLDEMVRKVVDVGKERKTIAEGMKDIGQALEAFDKVLMFVWLLISVFIFRKSPCVASLAGYMLTLCSGVFPQQLRRCRRVRRYCSSVPVVHFCLHHPGVPCILSIL